MFEELNLKLTQELNNSQMNLCIQNGVISTKPSNYHFNNVFNDNGS